MDSTSGIQGLNPKALVTPPGTEEEIMAAFRQVRDALRDQLMPLLREKSSGKNS